MGGDQIGEIGESERAKGGDGMVGGLVVRNMDGIGQKRSDDKRAISVLLLSICMVWSVCHFLVREGWFNRVTWSQYGYGVGECIVLFSLSALIL
jgi:hypothetical protein